MLDRADTEHLRHLRKVPSLAVAWNSAYHVLPYYLQKLEHVYVYIYTHVYFFSNISEDVYTYMLMYIVFKWENK